MTEAEQHPGHVRWFGPSWHAPICHSDYETDVPVGEPCIFCRVQFQPGDQGISMMGFPERQPAHLLCLLRNVGQSYADVDHNPFIVRPDPPKARP